MNRELPNDIAKFFQEAGRIGGKIGGKRSLETMTPEERSERAKKAAAASADARRNRGTGQLPALTRKPEALCSATPPYGVILRGWRTKNEVLIVADQVLTGLHGYAQRGSRKRRDFYRNDLQWLCDVLMRVDAGERDLLRPTGE
jgi:hypothetical protein